MSLPPSAVDDDAAAALAAVGRAVIMGSLSWDAMEAALADLEDGGAS